MINTMFCTVKGTPGDKMTAECMEMEEFGSGDREEEDEEDEDEDEVFQKMKQLTNIRRDGERLVITTAGGEELVMERAAREVITTVPYMGNEDR